MNMQAFRLTVRQHSVTGRTVFGAASTLPRLSRDWRDIASYGCWTGSQTRYRPYRRALSAAAAYAEYCNGLAGL